MQKRYNILISAYACSPYHGSEAGMGWNFIINIARYHNVHVIVEKLKWEKPINEFKKKHPVLLKNITFHFIEKKRRKTLRKIWPPSYYWFYRRWQKEAFKLATNLIKTERFHLVHQLNMVGYREPGYLWKIKMPFVWGPIGGLENTPTSFIWSLGSKGIVHFLGRNLLNFIQRNFLYRPRKAARRESSQLITATSANRILAYKLWNKDSELISEVGQDFFDFEVSINLRESHNEPLKIIWSGVHTPRKNLPLLIRALKKVNFDYELHILGEGEMSHKWKKLAMQSNLSGRLIWWGRLDRDKAVEIMNSGHVFCITSVYDLTATVTLEALTVGLPIICLNHMGFGSVVTEECGIKIPITNPRNAADEIAKALNELNYNESYRRELSKGALARAKLYNWNNKVDQLNQIYNSLINSGK